MAAPTGYCILSSDTPPLRVLGRHGTNAPKLSGGYGGATEIGRPRDAPLTEYSGRAAMQLTLDLLLDGLMTETDQSPFVRNLDRMMRADDATGKLPVVMVDTELLLSAWTNAKWLPVSLEWGDAVNAPGGVILRQQVTVTLMEQQTDERLAKLSASTVARARADAEAKKTHVVKKGETLQTIAQKRLGDKTKWKAIAKLNNIRDPRTLKVGQRLRLP